MDKTVRVLHVIGGMNRGGAESLIMNIYRNIDRTKVQFDFAVHTTEKCSYDDEIRELGGRIYRLPKYNIINHFKYVYAWNKLLRTQKFDYVHGHLDSIASVYLKIAKKHNLYTIAHSHSISSGTGIKSFIINIYHKGVNKYSDKKVACSVEAGHWLFGRNNNVQFQVVKNGIDVKKFIFNKDVRIKVRNNLKISNNIVIGHVGNYRQEKNHKFIIDLFYKLSKDHPNFRLVLIGSGVPNNLDEQVSELGIRDNVVLLDSSDCVHDYMQAFDIFLLPSNFEGLGMVLIEAQASGLNCIASNNVPIEAKITDHLVFLPINRPESIDLWIKEILQNIKYERNDMYDCIVNKGYDISNTTKILQEFYTENEE